MRHFKLKECNFNLPDAIVACRLINEVQFQLVLSTVLQMSFEEIRKTLKKLFSQSSGVPNFQSSLENIKIEQVNEKHGLYLSDNNWSSYQKQNYQKLHRPPGSKNNRKTNPVIPDGNISVCAICGSRMHWAMVCPHSYENLN